MKKTTTLILLAFICLTCKKERSGEGEIIDYFPADFNISEPLLDTVVIDKDNRVISLLFNDALADDAFPVSFTAEFTISDGAICNPSTGNTVTINARDEWFEYTLTAENGHLLKYFVTIRDNQLPGSDFEDWYTATGMDGKPYPEPGKSEETTIWATANKGTSIYGIYGTVPVIDGDNTMAGIATGETSAIPVTAGTLYTGRFNLNGAINNPTDPRKASILGIPFVLRPVAMKFKYSYHPGERYVKATPNNPDNIFGGFTIADIPGEDMFSIYAYLEVREGDSKLEIGRAEISSGVQQNDLTEITIPFTYSSSSKPTHINLVMASSKDGHLYTGAVGSVLTVDDFELLYQE